MGKLVEGVWDCSFCDTKNIKASKKECPQCGSPQGEDTVFRLPDTITYVSEEKAKTISRNPDWQCSYCEQLNRDTDNLCKGCGASRAESTQNYFQMRQKNDEKKHEEEIEHETEEIPKDQTDSKKISFFKESFSNIDFRKIFVSFAAVIGILSLIALIVVLVMPKTQTVNVNGFEWERSIAVEEYQTVKESDWKLPSDARLLYTQEELQRYDKVIDHYETVTRTESREVVDHYETVITGYKDLGNGYFEEQTEQQPVYRTEYYEVTEQEPVYIDVPIYATKYYYEIDKWTIIDYIKTNGTDKSPYWGNSNLNSNQREGQKTETFRIVCTNENNESHTYTVNKSEWDNIDEGDTLKIKVNAFGIILEIEHIEKLIDNSA